MTRETLIERLVEPRFPVGFATTMARKVLADDAFDALYSLAADSHDNLSREVRHRLYFRAAYVLERIFFIAPEMFAPYIDDFFRRGFSGCTDAGARRHFAKIMAHLLREVVPDSEILDRIAETAARWAIDPKTKIAVRIWCVEVLRCCRGKCPWVNDLWVDLLATLANDASPAIAARMRNGWKE